MRLASLVLLGLAVGLGAWLACQHIYAAAQRAKRPRVAALHGAAGSAGLLLLLAGLRFTLPSPAAVRFGVAGFGAVAAALLGAAWVLGGFMLILGLSRRRYPGFVLAMHAAAAICGATLLLAMAGLQG